MTQAQMRERLAKSDYYSGLPDEYRDFMLDTDSEILLNVYQAAIEENTKDFDDALKVLDAN